MDQSSIPEQVTCEVCVVGAGPSGSVLARRLGELGCDVLLLDREVFPRPHVGESMPPTASLFFEELGLLQKIESEDFLRTDRALVAWSLPRLQEKQYTNVKGFQVDRSRFDHLLLESAREAGVRILTGTKASKPVRSREHKGFEIPCETHHSSGNNKKIIIFTKFLVDATGRKKDYYSIQSPCSPPTRALYAYWNMDPTHNSSGHSEEQFTHPSPFRQGKDICTAIEAIREGWIWGGPLSHNRFVAAIFLDRVAKEGEEVGNYYERLLSDSFLFSELSRYKRDGNVLAADATSYFSNNPVEEDYLAVGDAFFAHDALSSQGVTSAMLGAIQGAIVAYTLIRFPESQMAAMEFYRDRLDEKRETHLKTSRELYTSQETYYQEAFWERRRNYPGDTEKNGRNTDTNSSSSIAPEQITIIEDQTYRPGDDIHILRTPAVVHNRIDYIPAIKRSDWRRPVAFIGPQSVYELFRLLPPAGKPDRIREAWKKEMPVERREMVLHWFISMGVIVPAE